MGCSMLPCHSPAAGVCSNNLIVISDEELSFIYYGFPHSSVGKESACNARDLGSNPGWGRSAGEGIKLLTPVFWPGEFHRLYASLLAQLVKSPPSMQCGRPGFDPCVGKIPWRREQLPTPVFWPGEFHRLYSS